MLITCAAALRNSVAFLRVLAVAVSLVFVFLLVAVFVYALSVTIALAAVPEDMRHDVMRAIAVLSGAPVPRVWSM